jgi:pimeloyl-ACP methyl ester carboxylesterase
VPETLPAWLTEADLDFFTDEFKRTGFRGGLNWYRNMDTNWKLTPFLSGAKIRQPSLFIAGEFDWVITIYRKDLDRLEETMPGLKKVCCRARVMNMPSCHYPAVSIDDYECTDNA